VARALRGADAVFIQRGLYPLGPGVVVEPIRRYKGRVVYDLDDAVFHTKPALANRGTFARWLYGAQQARQLLQRADAVVVSSVELADALPSYVAAPIVLPTVPDPQRYLVAEPQNESELPLRVGWAGTVGNIAYLESLRGVFERLAREGIARLEVVSSEPWDGPAAFHRWELEEEAQLFARFSVGIMPLPDTPYTRAKAGFKLLQYMAAGLPVVASPIGVNRELIQRSGGGFLASSGDEWLEALEALARSADLRHEMGRRGRAFVESYADLDAQAGTLTKLLRGRS
jgi:glycosyltransferase involved in cell wall biosynthesis